MENDNFLEKMVTELGQSASVKHVFGEPVQVGGKTIIPVAHIAIGVGGGYGKTGKPTKKQVPVASSDASADNVEFTGDGGGGGGLYATPKGVYEITPTSTRFIPVFNLNQILLGIGAGFVLSRLLFSRRVNHPS